ncbi:cobaltochelatase subunit CobN [Proteiniphilum acetatigenes]|uniref:cobaltochelatase subunit CobN n=1 Tax=Proteiniphilum acetatigenes TaxID=294710 RepID=UPI0003797778|nr:cobaltochelatase subunit CobN [Proteiniphilum acetatigenes]
MRLRLFGKKPVLPAILLLLIVLVAGFAAWGRFASKTRIALVNYPLFQLSGIVKSNADPFISYENLSVEGLNRLSKYDFVLIFGRGLDLSEDQREQLLHAAGKGTAILVDGATNPENNIVSLDSIQKAEVYAYLANGNRRNYANLGRYVRRYIDKKVFFVSDPAPVVESARDVLYHLDDNMWFDNVPDYEAYLKENNFYTEGGAKVAIVGGLNDPFSGNRENLDSMIVTFQRAGLNVYPVLSSARRLGFLRQIRPDAVVYLAHGRMLPRQGDAVVDWLKEKNIPVFAPLTVLQTREEWQKDAMGMSGGFLSQSIIMPELDGAVYPYVVNSQEEDENGLFVFRAIPERLERFTEIIRRFIALQRKGNAGKKIAIYYFKGPGQSALVAQGLETVPSLYNFLKRLKAEGYKVDNLPATGQEFEKLLMQQGAVMSPYAEGAFDQYLASGNPALVEKTAYESWVREAMPEELYAEVTGTYGEAPGSYMSVDRDGKSYLAVARVELGNIALLPQPMAALGSDEFAIVHGAKSPPPHTYIAAYLWAEHAFHADAMLHFGTHGSLEFTPAKQVALGSDDWPDRLVGTIPHFYYYTIGNVGESMMAKRRSYATTVSYLTPPFMESSTRSQFRDLQDKIRDYYKATDEAGQEKISLEVKGIAVEMGLHRDLRLDSILTNPYTAADIERIENFAEEIANEKMTGQLYITGVPYEEDKINSTVRAMTVDPVAYSLAALDRHRGRVTDEQLKNNVFFTWHYLDPAKTLVDQVLSGKAVNDALISRMAGITEKDIEEAERLLAPPGRRMMDGKSEATTSAKPDSGVQPAGSMPVHGRPANAHTGGHPVEITKEQKEHARAIIEVDRAMNNIIHYRDVLRQSPELEMQSLLNALSGGYIAPSPGGDAVASPNAVPTGRNLYAVNTEATPSETAWDKGIALVNATLENYRNQHGGYPKKVSYTFWSSEFIETEGATIAQVLYMLGVEPVRDAFGRVSDIRLIPSEVLGRPRIDVVVQTSGQFRDLAASRLALISRAVEMAAAAKDDTGGNYVSSSATETERLLVEQGVSPKEARELSVKRIFGGLNGMYGTGIQEMVTSGDRWENEGEIADTYIHNMSAVYGSEKEWGQYHEGLLRAVLHNTDVVVQPRQSNTWGALSLDHVYEFMGGMNLAVRHVTGKDPDAYFADYRNRHHARMQDVKEAIGVETRSTIFNPAYIRELMKGQATSAAHLAEVATNTYAWNVMKPEAIDNEVWDRFYEVYVMDAHDLGVRDFFKRANPAALEEMTAVMLETARKGMWKATDRQLADVARLHTDIVAEFGHSGAGFSGGNTKLQDFIAEKASGNAGLYRQELRKMNRAEVPAGTDNNGMVLKKQSLSRDVPQEGETTGLNGILVVSGVLVVFVALLFLLQKRRTRKKISK